MSDTEGGRPSWEGKHGEYTDASTGECLQDITELLDSIMETNAASFTDCYTFSATAYFLMSPASAPSGAYISLAKASSALVYACMVTDHAPWDIKFDESLFSLKETYIYNGNRISAEDAGNIHFGYVGAAVFSGTFLHFGAGLNQAKKGIHLEFTPFFFDEPRDYAMVEYGVNLYHRRHQP